MSGSNLTLPTETEEEARERLAEVYDLDAAVYESLSRSAIAEHLVGYFRDLACDYRSRAASLRAGKKE